MTRTATSPATANPSLSMIRQAMALHQQGQLGEAEQLYTRILQVQHDHFNALHLLGVLMHQRGRSEEALNLIAKALATNVRSADAYANQGRVLAALGRHNAALASYDLAIALKPDHLEALFHRSNALGELKRFEEALASYDRVLALLPNYADALNNRGVILHGSKRYEEALASYDRALVLLPDNANVLNNRGNTLGELKRFEEALASYDHALSVRPDYAEALYNRGKALKELKRFDDALGSYNRALALRSDYAEALQNRGNTLHELKRFDEALASYDRALALQSDNAEALNNRGNALRELERFDEALVSYDRALASWPDYAEARSNRGIVLHELKRFDEALASYDRVLSVRPDYAEAVYNRGITLHELKRFDEALASYDHALSMRPDLVEALNNRGVTLKELKRFGEALASYDHLLSMRPNHAETFSNRGVTLHELKRFDEALASYDRALAVRPDYADALYNRGNALHQLKRFDEALASYDHALALRPDNADALSNRGVTLHELKRFDEALASYDRALAVKADHEHAFSGAAWCVTNLCDWDRRTPFTAEINAHVSGKKSIISPFVLFGYSGDPALQLQCAKNFIVNRVPLPPRPLWTGQTWRHDKLRIAYLSADFRAHATAFLMTELFEKHDRSRFEIIGVSFGVDDASDVRKRLVAAFDEFHDVSRKSDEEVAKLLQDLQVDIAIDLKGHTQDSRFEIFEYRPAPIQVSYLGYPGTIGTQAIDYIIADKVVAPFEHQQFYTERIVHLPECYQVNDTKRKIAERTPTRQEAGLPEHEFVFCSFNNNWKIEPTIFDIWMRLLHQVEGSALWLLRGNDGAEQNLRKEAQRRGIDPSRLVFAGRLPPDEHLARHNLADLFLDTLPCNAHTTASDALWMGLPLLTCQGKAFAGRVAASLLHAVGVPELIASNLEEYQTLALKFARDPALLAKIKTKLAQNRNTYPLFNTDRFARHIEAAFTTMWETWQHGEAPKSFSIEPID